MATCSSCILLFPLLIIFASAFSAHAAPPPEVVRDLTGKMVRSGIDYYIVPLYRRGGGGLTLRLSRNETCPFNVAQDEYEVYFGTPVTFHPVDPKKGVVRPSTDLNIKFSSAPETCAKTTLWQLAAYDADVKQYFVTTGGQEGNPGRKTLRNWFKIERFHDEYKLSYCPSVCKFCKVICKDFGIYVDNNGVRRLALSDKPFKIVFLKV